MPRPRIQNAPVPPAWNTKTRPPSTERAISEKRITRRGPIQSSRKPQRMVEIPAVTLATAPKMMTSPAEKPNVPAAMTAPNVNTPASPSRNTAEAMRKVTSGRSVCHRLTRVRHSSRYEPRIPGWAPSVTRRGWLRSMSSGASVNSSVHVAQKSIETLMERPSAPVTPNRPTVGLSLIHISEPTRQAEISYAVFCLKKKKKDNKKNKKKKKKYKKQKNKKYKCNKN